MGERVFTECPSMRDLTFDKIKTTGTYTLYQSLTNLESITFLTHDTINAMDFHIDEGSDRINNATFNLFFHYDVKQALYSGTRVFNVPASRVLTFDIELFIILKVNAF